MSEVLHLGCGDDYRPNALNVDVNPESRADMTADLTETPWPFDDNEFRTLVAHQLVEHLPDREAFFEEAARVLVPGGKLVISVPLGRNARTDDDHKTVWTYGTPEQYSQPHRRPWDPSPSFELVDRDLDVWLGGPLGPLTPLFQKLAEHWPDWAAYRCYAGVLTAQYEVVK